MKKRLLALGLALCLALTACGGEGGVEDTPQPAPTPTASAEPVQFALACYPEGGSHPITGTDRMDLALSGLIYEGLFALDSQFQPHEQLCASYTVSEDALTWTFDLRSGVTFSDGSPLTSKEVAASLELARTSGLYKARFADVTSIRAGEGTVTISLGRANGALPALLDVPIVKETGGTPLGTGPYVLTGSGEELALTARSGWWQGKALPIQTIPLRPMQEADDLIHAFDTRDIALVATDLTGTNALGFSGSFETVDYPTSNMIFVGFNTAKGPCADVTVRRALQYGFDRSAVATLLLSRHALPAALPISPVSPLYPEELGESLEYSPQTLADTLTAGGWTKNGDGWYKGRQALELDFVVPTGNNDRVAVAQHLAEGLRQAGIQVELRQLAWDAYLQALAAGDFDLYLGEVRLTADFDLTAFIAPTGALNYGKYNDAPAVNALLAYRASTGQGRAAAAQQLCQRLTEAPPFAVLGFKNWSVLTQWSSISGLTPTQQNVFYGFADWKLS